LHAGGHFDVIFGKYILHRKSQPEKRYGMQVLLQVFIAAHVRQENILLVQVKCSNEIASSIYVNFFLEMICKGQQHRMHAHETLSLKSVLSLLAIECKSIMPAT
jgi:hypothetical protein